MKRAGWLLGLLVTLASAPVPCSAQEPKWLNDFEAARKEAKAQQRPIVMDVGTENCVWCRRLEATTFQDAAVKKLLAERFIAVRIDADQHRGLVQSLGIGTFPTLVFADTNGKILGLHEGYVEAEQFRRQLDRAMRESGTAAAPPATAPATTATTTRTTVASVEPPRIAVALPAGQLLKLAKEDERNRHYLSAMDRCRMIQAAHAGSAEAAEAQKLLAAIKSDPEKCRQVRAAIDEIQAELDLAGAERAMQEGRFGDAVALLEHVQRLCPGTARAAVAREYLTRMRTSPPIIQVQSR